MTDIEVEHTYDQGAAFDDDVPFVPQVALPRSVAEALADAHSKAAAEVEREFEIPGYGGGILVGTFRAVRDLDQFTKAVVGAPSKRRRSSNRITRDGALGLIEASCLSTTTVIGEKEYPGPPLGLELYDQLFPPESRAGRGPADDRQAIVLLFPRGQVSLVNFAGELHNWMSGKAVESDEEILGES